MDIQVTQSCADHAGTKHYNETAPDRALYCKKTMSIFLQLQSTSEEYQLCQGKKTMSIFLQLQSTSEEY